MRRGAARDLQIEQLRAQGFVVVPQVLAPDNLQVLNRVARAELAERRPPMEFEADLQYPGAPPSRAAAGGTTIRRLLAAYARHPAFAAAATLASVRVWMSDYFKEAAFMSRVHHNCLMTKHPRYGSLTGWHRDIRYWSFAREDLVSVWFALGGESVDNGGLWFVPGSHVLTLEASRYDAVKFFRTDLPDNAEVLAGAVSPVLTPGDAVFFHSNTLHSAGKNMSDAVKFSLVFTYHGGSNSPLHGTRSAGEAEVPLL